MSADGMEDERNGRDGCCVTGELRQDGSMRFLRKRAPIPAEHGPRPVTFSGFAELVPYLYEFRTSGGQDIYLHDMDCVGIKFTPSSRRLDLRFHCPAAVLAPHPLTLTLTFDEAKIYQWLDDAVTESEPTPAEVRGQVRDLSQDVGNVFSLQLLDVYLIFEASSVTCIVEPGPTS